MLRIESLVIHTRLQGQQRRPRRITWREATKGRNEMTGRTGALAFIDSVVRGICSAHRLDRGIAECVLTHTAMYLTRIVVWIITTHVLVLVVWLEPDAERIVLTGIQGTW